MRNYLKMIFYEIDNNGDSHVGFGFLLLWSFIFLVGALCKLDVYTAVATLFILSALIFSFKMVFDRDISFEDKKPFIILSLWVLVALIFPTEAPDGEPAGIGTNVIRLLRIITNT